MFVMSLVLISLLCANAVLINSSESDFLDANQLHTEGQIKILMILKTCANFTSTHWTYINSAIWTVEKINSLNYTHPLNLGLSLYGACTEVNYYDPVYKVFRQNDESFLLGVISSDNFPDKIVRFANLLDVYLEVIGKYRTFLVKAAVKLLATLSFTKDVIVYCEDREILEEFYKYTRDELICVKKAFMAEERDHAVQETTTSPIVMFGSYSYLKALLTNFSVFKNHNDKTVIVVPFDDTEDIDFPEGSYLIQPSTLMERNSTKVYTPLLFDIANPIINFGLTILHILRTNCNKTIHKLSCIRQNLNKSTNHLPITLTPLQILKVLEIEDQIENFAYDVFLIENLTWQNNSESQNDSIFQSFLNVYRYYIFNDTITGFEDLNSEEVSTSFLEKLCTDCNSTCINFVAQKSPRPNYISYAFSKYGLRNESWIFAFLAISVLGVALCIAVLMFLIVRFCKRDILEGNPFLSLLLLLSAMLMYVSVIPFTLDSDKDLKNTICLSRALSTTLVYAFAFSLLLSRSILLATVSREVGFMSHIPGPVQSFLTLFMFGVQAALSLQFVNHCEDIFRGISFVYMMSYNSILLILLLFITPLNAKTQRNYKEGKYFTIAIVLLACTWSCWLPCYAVMGVDWRDPILCLGLIATASILLGVIFIPRTYMMTIAAARDRITNALPSLPTNSSIMDVYRASNQPVYDCINVAAINAATRARNTLPPPPPPQPDDYPTLRTSYDDEFDFERCITPNQDKVTRF